MFFIFLLLIEKSITTFALQLILIARGAQYTG